MSKNFILYGFCSLGNFDNAQKILIQNIDNIDILYDNGVFFDFAIVKNDITFLKLLLKYAKEKQYSESEIVEILSKIPENNISLEMRKVLAPYLNESIGDDLSDIQLECIETTKSNENSNDSNHSSAKKEEGLNQQEESKLTSYNLEKLPENITSDIFEFLVKNEGCEVKTVGQDMDSVDNL